MRWRIAEAAVSILRVWYGLRERLGHPRRVPMDRFDEMSDTVLLAGSPWAIGASTSTAAPTHFYITNTTWPLRLKGD